MIINGNFNGINITTDSIFILNQGSNLQIQNSTFNQISCTEIGGIISSNYQNTITSIYDSSFVNNTSIAGALFLIENESSVILYRWKIFQNFAITAGLIVVNNDGYFEIYNSTIYQNYAMMNIIAEITSSSYLWIIDSSTIYNNMNIYQTDIVSEFNSTWSILCFVPVGLRIYILSNPSLYDYQNGSKLFELIDAKLSIQNGTIIYNQKSILKSFLTLIMIEDSVIYSMSIRDNWIRLAESTLNITNSKSYTISSYDNSNFIYADYKSTVNIYTFSYTNASSPFLYSIKSQVTSDGLIISNCITSQEWLLILSASVAHLNTPSPQVRGYINLKI